MLKVRFDISTGFQHMLAVRTQVQERWAERYGLSEEQQTYIAVRLFNLTVNLGEKPTPEVISQVLEAVEQADEQLQQMDEEWIKAFPTFKRLKFAVTVAKAIWSPDLSDRRP